MGKSVLYHQAVAPAVGPSTAFVSRRTNRIAGAMACYRRQFRHLRLLYSSNKRVVGARSVPRPCGGLGWGGRNWAFPTARTTLLTPVVLSGAWPLHGPSGPRRGPSGPGKSRAGGENGDCHQFASRHDPRNKALSLKRIGWLYPIFRDLHFYHGLLAGRVKRPAQLLLSTRYVTSSQVVHSK